MPNKPEKSYIANILDTLDKPANPDKLDRLERSDRPDKRERSDRSYRPDRRERSDRQAKANKPGTPINPQLHKKNVNKRAIALKYDSERGSAPLITAVGKGQVAEKIIEVAEHSGVARVEDEFQANALSAFDAGARVPKFLYDLVAEVLLFIEEADTNNEYRRNFTGINSQ